MTAGQRRPSQWPGNWFPRPCEPVWVAAGIRTSHFNGLGTEWDCPLWAAEGVVARVSWTFICALLSMDRFVQTDSNKSGWSLDYEVVVVLV